LKKRFILSAALILIAFNVSFSQFLPSLAIAGGPFAGWHFNNTDELNAELKKAGFPELSNGFFTLGGGGFVDIPLKKENQFLRIGGMGIGFSSNKDLAVNDSLTKAETYSFGFGGFSLDFVKSFQVFDITVGLLLGTGTLSLDLYQYGKDYGNSSVIFGEFGNNSSSPNITRNFRVRFYSAQPQIGFGILLRKFVYLKFNAGYLLSVKRTWKVDNDVEVKNFPEGVGPKGFNMNLGLNFGIFFRD
jgi:hypothetical protein